MNVSQLQQRLTYMEEEYPPPQRVPERIGAGRGLYMKVAGREAKQIPPLRGRRSRLRAEEKTGRFGRDDRLG